MKYIILLLILSFAGIAEAVDPVLDPLVGAEDHRDFTSKDLVAAETSSHSQKRAEAARALGRILKPECVEPLFELLAGKNVTVIKESLFALGQFGWKKVFAGGHEDEIIAKIQPFLRHKDASVRATAVEALGKLVSDAQVSILVPPLNDKSPGVRAEALMALYRARLIWGQKNSGKTEPDYSTDILTAIEKLAADKNSEVRRNVAFYFARSKDKRGVDVLMKLATDKNEWTRFFAASGLETTGDSHALPLLVALTKDTADAVRGAAVQAIGTLGAAEQIPAQVGDDTNLHVRWKLVEAYGKSKKVDAAAIRKFQNDKSVMVRAEVVSALVAHDPTLAPEVLSSAIASTDWLVRRTAADASAALGSKQEDFLNSAWHDSDYRVQISVLDGMAGIKTKSAYAFLISAVASDNLAIRQEAASDLAGRDEPRKIDDAWAAYNSNLDVSDAEVRDGLIDVFDSIVNPQTTAYLEKILKDPNYQNARKAYEDLKKRSDQNAKAPAEVFTDSPFKNLAVSQNPIVTLFTTRGRIVIRCLTKEAPIQVANFVGLAKQGFYNGLNWHRIETNFVVQGGGPLDGFGRADYSLRAEINRVPFKKGSVGMPRGDHFDTGDWEIFIDQVPTPHLDGQYTVFGEVIEGLDILDRLEIGDIIDRALVADGP